MSRLRAATRIPPPRLLPLAILAMASLLVIKSGDIVRAASNETAPDPVVHRPQPLLRLAAVSSPPAPPTQAASPAPVVLPAPSPSSPQAAKTSATEAPPTKAESLKSETAVSPRAADASGDTPVSDSERKLLTDLRQRRQELDAREASIASREATLTAVERRLGARVDQLTALQHQLETLEQDRKARDEANWGSLVKTYETMKPKDAATIFNDLDLPVLLPVMDRMKEAKLAPILSSMQPERARQVTSELAQMRLKANRLDTNAPQSSKGGPNRPPGG